MSKHGLTQIWDGYTRIYENLCKSVKNPRTSVFLKAENLSKLYKKDKKEVHAVSGVSLEVRKGQILVIIGPSGAGKSTLLHLLGGLDKPTLGNVSLNGIDLYSMPDSLRASVRNERIGFVFQFYHLLPEFTALENVMLPALMRKGNPGKRKKIRDKASWILENIGLRDRTDYRPNELSGGEAQRVAIARALINEPDIVLCDEPTGNLDSGTSNEIRDLIRRLNKERRVTFVIVTHEPSLQELATEILHIRDGRMDRG